ncbi:MAG: phage portal protein [Sphaerochaetaceae bacterium]
MKRKHRLRRSLYDLIFGTHAKKKAVDSYFKTLTAYSTSFTSWDGGVYEANLTRACIEAGARQASKLEPNVAGVAEPQATRALLTQPNPWSTTPQFLARIWTCLMANDSCLIVPVIGSDGLTQVGYSVALPGRTDAVEDSTGALWLRMQFSSGDVGYIEWSRVGVMTRHQFRSDLFGDQLNTLDDTLQLIDAQKQAELAAIKNGASIRFLGKLGQNMAPDDIAAKRKEFNSSNLGKDNEGGIALYDMSFDSVTQVTPTSWTIDTREMERIRTNAHDHFGTNDTILHSQWSEDEWNAFYEGMIEPFAVMLGAVLTSMTYTPYEIANHNQITFSANRLQYASNTTKLNVTTNLVDRGIMTVNQALDVWQMPQIGPDGDQRIIRGEYIDASLISEHTVDDAKAALAANAISDSTQQPAQQGGGNAQTQDTN